MTKKTPPKLPSETEDTRLAEQRRIILARRARFIAAAMAASGLSACASEGEPSDDQPADEATSPVPLPPLLPCLSPLDDPPPRVCLSPPDDDRGNFAMPPPSRPASRPRQPNPLDAGLDAGVPDASDAAAEHQDGGPSTADAGDGGDVGDVGDGG